MIRIQLYTENINNALKIIKIERYIINHNLEYNEDYYINYYCKSYVETYKAYKDYHFIKQYHESIIKLLFL